VSQAQLHDLADWTASVHYSTRQRQVLALCDAITQVERYGGSGHWNATPELVSTVLER